MLDKTTELKVIKQVHGLQCSKKIFETANLPYSSIYDFFVKNINGLHCLYRINNDYDVVGRCILEDYLENE